MLFLQCTKVSKYEKQSAKYKYVKGGGGGDLENNFWLIIAKITFSRLR